MTNFEYWNYRIIRRRDGYLEMREVYYDQDRHPVAFVDATPVTGDDVAGIKMDLAARLGALDRAILTETDEGLKFLESDPG
jgi:hypothetical protein